MWNKVEDSCPGMGGHYPIWIKDIRGKFERLDTGVFIDGIWYIENFDVDSPYFLPSDMGVDVVAWFFVPNYYGDIENKMFSYGEVEE